MRRVIFHSLINGLLPATVGASLSCSVVADRRSCANPASERFADNSVDMGTGFDCFSPLSHTLNPAITGDAMANRLLLKTSMREQGFRNLAEEWWHYTLVDEPYPDTYFDVPVR